MTPEPFVARVSVPKVLALLACCLILLVAGIWMILNADDSHRMPKMVGQTIGVVTVAFAGLSTLGIGSLLDLGRPLQRIPWSAIKRARLRRNAAQSWIMLSLHEPSCYPPRPLRRPVATLSRCMGFGDINFSNQASDQGFDATLAAVRRFAPDLTIEGQSFPNTAS